MKLKLLLPNYLTVLSLKLASSWSTVLGFDPH